MHKKKSPSLKERITDLEIKVEAFQPVNLSLIHLLVEVLAVPDEKAEYATLLSKWKTSLNSTAHLKVDYGLEVQLFCIRLLADPFGKISRNPFETEAS